MTCPSGSVEAVAEGSASAGAPFGVRLQRAMRRWGPVCAGIDPHPALVDSWGLPYDLSGLERFSMTCVEAFAGQVAAVKPQSAFFEVFGSPGVALLERVVTDLQREGTQVIVDVKRGDIGSTMQAYAEAFLGAQAPCRPDAITLSPYLGYGSLRPAVDLALQTGAGVFVLALTSNPEGKLVQHAELDGTSVAGHVVTGVGADNASAGGRGEWGSVGMVVGATVGDAVADLGLDLAAANAPLLAPGLGAQGATADDLRRVFGAALPRVLASSSREILSAGPDVVSLRERARVVADSVRALVEGA
ncbi:Orotidine 5'-phosphate decarboxylase [Austwickia sp. TVS 96-490-7B]|uniref:orotidine-5'-phosphate decarboxylase n=1 Tax=Austwickia sp. TVS 96-490-7B TaxID=2830843 RepID=UPI001C585BFA|nr:orotidine-5'-phosphate decarboxylase [Austwickia sp. TVS 96-490-7B]MBW3086034.1 Orotidine 5'-phosphate decarboxylase [Austwickia sp. TVS 96-490-7B]